MQRLEKDKNSIFMKFNFWDVISVLTVLCASITAIVGNTWDGKEKGLRKLTGVGRFALAIALVATGLSVNQIVEKNEHLVNARKMKQIAYADISESLDGLRQPFYMLLAQVNDSINLHSMHFSSMVIARPEVLDSLVDSVLLKDDRILGKIDFRDHPKLSLGPCCKNLLIWEVLNQFFNETKRGLDNAMTRFGPYIPEELLVRIVELLHTEAFVFNTELLPKLAQQTDGSSSITLGDEFYDNLFEQDTDKESTFVRDLVDIQKIVDKK
jgi:hypothetical protein